MDNKENIECGNARFDKEYASGLFDRLMEKGRFVEADRDRFMSKVSTQEGAEDWFNKMVAKGRYKENDRATFLSKMYPAAKGVSQDNAPAKTDYPAPISQSQTEPDKPQHNDNEWQEKAKARIGFNPAHFQDLGVNEEPIQVKPKGLQENIQGALEDDTYTRIGNNASVMDNVEQKRRDGTATEEDEKLYDTARKENRDLYLRVTKRRKEEMARALQMERDKTIKEIDMSRSSVPGFIQGIMRADQPSPSAAFANEKKRMREMNPRIEFLARSLNHLEEAEKYLSLDEDKSWWGRVGDGIATAFDIRNIGTLGMYSIDEAAAISKALNNVSEGKASDDEKELVEAFTLACEAKGLYKGGNAFAIGQSLEQSMEFMLEMAVTGGVIKGIGEGITKGIEKGLVKGLTNKIKNTVLKKAANGILTAPAKMVGGAAATMISPSTYVKTEERQQGNYNNYLDYTGQLVVEKADNPESRMRSIFNASLENGISRFVERGIGPISEKALGFVASKIPFKIDLFKNASPFISAARNTFKDLMSIQGFTSETLEEFIEEPIQRLLVAQTATEKESGMGRGPLYDEDFVLQTLGSVGIMQAALGMPSAISAGNNTLHIKRALVRHRKHLQDEVVDKINAFFDSDMSDTERARGISSILQNALPSEREHILGYFAAKIGNEIGRTERYVSVFNPEVEKYRTSLTAASAQGGNILFTTDRDGSIYAYEPNPKDPSSCVAFRVSEDENGDLVFGKPEMRSTDDFAGGETQSASIDELLADKEERLEQQDKAEREAEDEEIRKAALPQITEESRVDLPANSIVSCFSDALGEHERNIAFGEGGRIVVANGYQPNEQDVLIPCIAYRNGNTKQGTSVFVPKTDLQRLLKDNRKPDDEGPAATGGSSVVVDENEVATAANDGTYTESEVSETEEPAAPQTEKEIKPIGEGLFGNIYDQFRGKAMEAVRFLLKFQSGEAKGVFHRNGLGDIDVVWGNEKGGLKHIIEKHIVDYSDFNSLDEAIDKIEDIINDGEIKNNGNKNVDDIVISKDGYKVVLARYDNGNFVLTAYDSTRDPHTKKRSKADATLIHQSIFNGGMVNHVSPSLTPNSADKGTEVSEENQVQLPENKVATMYESLLSENDGNEAEAVDTATQMVVNTQAELDKAQKAATNGKTVEAIQAAKRAKREKIAALEKELKFWKDVAGYPETKRQAEEEARKQQKRIDAQQRAEQARKNNPLRLRLMDRDNALGEPLSLEEYVLRRIATGATKFLWNGTSEGTGGLKDYGGGKRFMLQYVDTNRGKVPELVADDMAQDIIDNYPEFGNVTASEILNVIHGIGVGEQGYSELMDRAEELHNRNDYDAQTQEEAEEAEREERANNEAAEDFAEAAMLGISDEAYYNALQNPRKPDDDVPPATGGASVAVDEDTEQETKPSENDIDVEFDASFPKDVEAVEKKQKGGKMAYAATSKAAFSGNGLFMQVKESGKTKSFAIHNAERYTASEITFRIEDGLGVSTDAARLLSDAVLELYKKNGLPIYTKPILRNLESKNDTERAVAEAEAEVETSPTDKQKEAGNYRKGHVKVNGFDITIENPKGAERSGVDGTGRVWRQTMNNTYGYIRGTEGVDGDHIDVFLSDAPETGDVFVVDQVNPKTGAFDEHKVMMGFDSEAAAREAYLSNYEDGWQGLGGITRVSQEEFKKWIDSSHRKTKPFADYKSVNVNEGVEEKSVTLQNEKPDSDEHDNGRNGVPVRSERVPSDDNEVGERGSRGKDSQEVQQESGRTDGSRAEGSGRTDGEIPEGDRRPGRHVQRLAERNTRNNHVDRGTDSAPTSIRARIEANIDAIELANQLVESGEEATPEQMAVLRKFSGWGGLGAAFSEYNYSSKLRKLLGEEAFEQAQMSRNSAFFTPASVIDALWDVAEAFGFKGGKVLEGSAGIGNILGLMPKHLSGHSDIQAIEIDETTGKILKLLYPDADVRIQGFETVRIPNNSVDLAITNVPFVTGLNVMDESGDKDLSTKFRNIHDFCIAKNVRKLKAGGLGIFITSSGTLDKSRKLRDWLVNEGNADVVGAFRLNNETFGGAGVTSDIIVVRKRVNGKKSANAIDVSETATPRTVQYKETDEKGKSVTKEYPVTYNKYFVEHPEHVAGEHKLALENGDTYRERSLRVYPVSGKNQSEILSDWAKHFSSMEWEATEEAPTEDSSYILDASADGHRLGEMYEKDGKLVVAGFGGYYPLSLNNNKVKGYTKEECFRDYAAIKEALSDVLKYQTENEEDSGLKPLLDRLNAAYDKFVLRYGNLNNNTAISFLKNDVEFAGTAAIENFKEEGNKDGSRKHTYSKSDVFNKRVVNNAKAPKPTNIKDGIVASIHKTGRIDMDFLVEQLGKSRDEVKDEIIQEGLGFEDPLSGNIEIAYRYLSGNVREKLKIAEESNGDGRFKKNIAALKKVIPQDIPAHIIDFQLGSSWVPPQLFIEYVKEKTDVDVSLHNIGGSWIMEPKTYTNNEKNRSGGVRSRMLGKLIPLHELIEAAIQNKTIRVTKTEKNGNTTRTIVDNDATTACATKIDEIKQEFKEWAKDKMKSDPEMAAGIEKTFNEQFNNFVPVSIPDELVPLHFAGSNPNIAMRSHQAKGAILATTQPVLLAHEVGTGKTFTLITAAMEMRRIGTAKKPMIVVQNSTVGQFVDDAKTLYPNAKILTLNENERGEEGRKAFYAKIKYNDWDLIVIPQSTFERIPDSEERQQAFIDAKIAEKEAVLEMMKQAGNGQNNSFAMRQAKKELEKLREDSDKVAVEASKKMKARDEKRAAIARQNAEVRAKELLDRSVDDVENFDDMGIDAILVDEAHEYKHLGFATAIQRGVKGVDPSPSKKSQGVFLKVQSVLEKNNGKNVVFATGTPVSNTAAEVWTFMRYLLPSDVMRSYGIEYFDDFVRNFGNISQQLEFQASGKFKENNRFTGYINVPELMRIWAGVADTVLTTETDVARKIPRTTKDVEADPKFEDEKTYGRPEDLFLPQTLALRSVMKYVRDGFARYEKMSGKEKKENSHIPLVLFGLAKAAAVDARLVMDDAADEENSKTNETVRQVLKDLKQTESYKGTVAIFADNYQNKNTGFNIYEDIRSKLIANGVPPEQVFVMKSGMSDKKKLEVFRKVNSGEIRVILGSTFTLGTGVNIQERMHMLVHLDAPNRPMDYIQRNGRLLRQGNLHNKWGLPVRVLRLGVEDSLDVTAYQRLKTKAAIVNSVMHGREMIANSMTERTLEEEEDVFGEAVAQLSGSEYAMLKHKAERDVRKYTAKKKGWEDDQTYINNQKPKLKGLIRNAENRKEANEKALNALKGISGNKIEINGNTYDNIDALGEFFKDLNAKHNKLKEEVKKTQPDTPVVSRLPIKVGGIDFVITTDISSKIEEKQGSLFSGSSTRITYDCPTLGIESEPVNGQWVKGAVEEIVTDVITGDIFRERLQAAENSIERYKGELSQMEAREGVPFQFSDELEKAKKNLEEYEQKMIEELAAKEEKYREMDESVAAATSLSEAVESTEEDAEDDTDRPKFAGEVIEKHMKVRDEAAEEGSETEVLGNAVADILRDAGIKVHEVSAEKAREMAQRVETKKSASETALPEEESSFKGTVVSSADGAKILKNLETIATEYERKSEKNTKTFIGDVAKALASPNKGMSSQYKTFEAKNGKTFTIRLSNHNAKVSNFDNAGESNGISIVVARQGNSGIVNDGNAHIVEFFYSDKALHGAAGKPLVAIIRSIEQALYSGEYKDTTGLAERQEVNGEEAARFSIRTFHGTRSSFEAFDFSHMGEGEGAQAYGWGGYVTEVEGIGRTYAESAYRDKSLLGLEHDYYAIKDNLEVKQRFLRNDREDLAEERKRLEESERQFEWYNKYAEWLKSKYGENSLQYQDHISNGVYASGVEVHKYNIRMLEKAIDSGVKEVAELEQALKDKLEEIKRRENNQPPKNLYTVEIPDNTGSNYLTRGKTVPKSSRRKVADVVRGMSDEELTRKRHGVNWLAEGVKTLANVIERNPYDAQEIRMRLVDAFGSEKRASEIMSKAGFVGIVYPAQYRTGGRPDGARNYVIFKESDMKITDHVQFMETPQGEVYGWTVGGEVYLNSEAMNPDTPIHEYTHLWDNALRKANPELWKRGVELMKKLPLWQEVVKDPNYAGIREDEYAVASEVHARLSGEEGARILDDMVEEGRKHGILGMAEAVGLKERIKAWVRDVLEWVRNAWDKWSGRDLSNLTIEEFAAMPIKDLMNGLNPLDKANQRNKVREVAGLVKKGGLRGVFGEEQYRNFTDSLEGKLREIGEKDDVQTVLNRMGDVGAGEDVQRAVYDAVRALLHANGIDDILDSEIDVFLYANAHPLDEATFGAERHVHEMMMDDLEHAADLERDSMEEGGIQFKKALTGSERVGLTILDKSGDIIKKEDNKISSAAEFGITMYELLNKDIRLKLLNEHLLRNGGRVTENTDLFVRHTQINGKIEYQSGRFERGQGKALEEASKAVVKAAKCSMYDLDCYLMAKHMPERSNWFFAKDVTGDMINNLVENKLRPLFEEKGIDLALTDKEIENLSEQVVNSMADKSGYMDTKHAEDVVDALIEHLTDKYDPEIVEAVSAQRDDLVDTFLSDVAETAKKRSKRSGDDYSGITGFKERLGMKPEEYVEMFEKRVGDRALLDNLHRAVADVAQFSMNNAVETGYMSDEERENILARGWQFYVPLRSWDEKNNGSDYFIGIDYGDSAREQGYVQKPKRAEGRRSMPDSPLEFLMYDAYGSIRSKEINEYYKAAGHLQEANEKFDYIFGRPDPLKETAFEKRAHSVVYYEDGVQKEAVFVNPLLAGVIRDEHGTWGRKPSLIFNRIRTSAQNGTRAISALVTQFSPRFSVSNFFRDTFYSIEKAVADGRYFGIGRAAKLLWFIFKNMGTAIASTNDRYVYESDKKGAKRIRAFMENGGDTGWHTINNRKQTKEILRKALEQGNTRKALREAFEVGKDAFRFLSVVSERTVRLGNFEYAKRVKKMSDRMAANYAKESSTNFDRRGRLADTEVGSLFTFLNAQCQGIDNAIQLTRKNPKNMAALMLLDFSIGLLQSIIQGALTDGDDDKDYNNRSWWARSRSYVIGGVLIPVAHFHVLFHGLGVAVGDYINGTCNKKEMVNNMFQAVGQELLPGPTNISTFLDYDPVFNRVKFTSDGLATIVPSLAVPAMEALVTNRDFKGATINKEPFTETGKELTPWVARAKKPNPYLDKLLVKVAMLSGYNPETDKNVSVKKDNQTLYVGNRLNSASTWEHLIKGYFGDPAGIVNGVSRIIAKAKSEDEDVSLKDFNFINSLWRPVDTDGAIMAKFMRLSKIVNHLEVAKKAQEKQLNGAVAYTEHVEANVEQAFERLLGLTLQDARSLADLFRAMESTVDQLRRLQEAPISKEVNEEIENLKITLMKQANQFELDLLRVRDPKRAERIERRKNRFAGDYINVED